MAYQYRQEWDHVFVLGNTRFHHQSGTKFVDQLDFLDFIFILHFFIISRYPNQPSRWSEACWTQIRCSVWLLGRWRNWKSSSNPVQVMSHPWITAHASVPPTPLHTPETLVNDADHWHEVTNEMEVTLASMRVAHEECTLKVCSFLIVLCMIISFWDWKTVIKISVQALSTANNALLNKRKDKESKKVSLVAQLLSALTLKK